MQVQDQRTTPGARYDQELIGALQYVFITMHKYDLGWVASQLNMEYQDLYNYVTGRRTMPITILRRITEVTKDKMFLDAVFCGSPIRWSFTSGTHAHSNDPITETFELVHAVGDLCESVKGAIVDGKIDLAKRQELQARIAFAAAELNDLHEVINAVKE